MKLVRWRYLCGLTLLINLLFHGICSFAQQSSFVESGTIEFEKKVNIFAKLRNRARVNSAITSAFVEEYRKNQQQFYTGNGMLNFSTGISTYTATDSATITGLVRNEPWVMVKNEVRHELKNDSISTLKKVFGQSFLIKDKPERIKWKLTNEVREIAGYSCKRANGVVMDSVYVVAFYSEEILSSAGPESFCGLPGMILGVALPHENVSWFATKVLKSKESSQLNLNSSEVQKAKKVNRKEYKSILLESMKDWGNLRWEALKAFML